VLRKIGAALLICCFAVPVLAQSYPTKPVRVLIPYPPGAVGDIMMRTVGERLGILLGQAFVIENRAGGGGLAATESVAKSPADGYTLLFNGPNHVTNLGLYKNVPYDPVADFAPISYVSSSQTILVTHASSGLKSVKELVEAAKAKPMAIDYASSGNGTGTHLGMEMFMRATGIQLTHIPFKGATPAFTALASGTVQVGFTTPPLAKQFIDEGRLNAIAVGGSKRLTGFPNVPSLADLGLLNYDVEVWLAFSRRRAHRSQWSTSSPRRSSASSPSPACSRDSTPSASPSSAPPPPSSPSTSSARLRAGRR